MEHYGKNRWKTFLPQAISSVFNSWHIICILTNSIASWWVRYFGKRGCRIKKYLFLRILKNTLLLKGQNDVNKQENFIIELYNGVVPPGVTMGDIYKSVWPFIGLQTVCLILIMVFPEIVLWLPSYFGM